MAKQENQKAKILYILDYLRQYSSETNPVNAAELIEMLASHDIHADRKTIYSDIETLREYGEDILRQEGRSGGYFCASRNFELSELKLLIDAVQSSRYLTEKKSRELIEKLCRECSQNDARLLRRNVLVAGRVKSMNETIYYSVDSIQEAIDKNCQITFRYCDWGLDGKKVFRDKTYITSPYALCQDSENCYLLARSSGEEKVRHYRVDRMMHIQLVPEARREPCPELTGEALNRYTGKLFNMFHGEDTKVRMRFHRKLTNVAVDRFGTDIIMVPDGEDSFVFTADVIVSPQFLSWIIGLGTDAKILHPAWAAQACADLCRQVAALYGPGAE